VVRVRLFGNGEVARAIALHGLVPRLARQRRTDLVLSPNFVAPMAGRCRSAVVVQDLAFVHLPSTIPAARRWYYHAVVRPSIRRAPAVLVSTRRMAEEVADYDPSVASRIRIAPLGVSPTHLANVSDAPRGPLGDLLCVGTLEPRKNLARVLTAHGRLCRRYSDFVGLRIVGARGWGRREADDALELHPAPEKVAFLGYLDDDALAAEYRRACGLVFCSLYEGFGLPLVEAMAHGCPVICSRSTALEEVAAGAAILADPFSTGEIEHAMLRLVEDRELRERLGRAGRRRAREFSWADCARRTADALHELGGEAA
jgi:alpha-1,3-rhamnosyl/mannosyltransferase